MRKSSFYSLIFTIFNDALGWGVVLTLFAPMLMGADSSFLDADTSLQTRNVILGLLIASYPLMQFFFMPLIGAVSDHLGRKKVLEWTILCAALTFVLSALAVWWGSLVLLFGSRALAGIFSANSATAQAAIADTSSEKEKGKNLSLSGIAGGVSWVVGPPLGGILSSKSYFSWADFSTPFWLIAVLFFINYFWVLWGFSETREKVHKEHHDWKQEIKDISKLAKIPKMSAWLVIATLFYFGWGFYILFYPALLVTKFHFDQAAIGLLSGYLAIFWLFSSTLLNRGLATRFTPETFILICLPTIGILATLVAYVPTIVWWYVFFPLLGICGAAAWINVLTLLSNLSGKENQGKIFGVAQSLMSLAMFVSPVLSGPLAAVDEKTPLVAGGICLIGTGLFALFYHARR